MQEALEVLRQCPIVSSEEISALRHQLLETHPNLSEAQRAQLFAQSLHLKLDEALALFDVSTKKMIKSHLLKQAVTKHTFSINALDVVETCTQINQLDAAHIHVLTSWVNQYEITPLNDAHLLALTHDFSSLEQALSPPLTASLEPNLPATVLKPFPRLKSSSLYFSRLLISIMLIGLTLWIGFFATRKWQKVMTLQRAQTFSLSESATITFPITLNLGDAANHLQSHLQYKSVNLSALKLWLQERHSILAEEPYFSAIIDTAHQYNINPLLLFAITGQEQSFVPTTHESAVKIANNPFNLYGSWKIYNTSIEDATEIAARTIIHLAHDCPDDKDQIQWINTQYADDPNWHIGVTYFLNELEKIAALY